MIDEASFVRAQRARNVSWQNIARMLGKCELDVRREYDTKFMRATPERVAPVVVRAPSVPNHPRQHPQAEAALRMIRDGETNYAHVGRVLGMNRKSVGRLARKHLEEPPHADAQSIRRATPK